MLSAKLPFLRGRSGKVHSSPMAGWSIQEYQTCLQRYYPGKIITSTAAPSSPPARHLGALKQRQSCSGGAARSTFPPLIHMLKGLRAKLGFPVPAISMMRWRKVLAQCTACSHPLALPQPPLQTAQNAQPSISCISTPQRYLGRIQSNILVSHRAGGSPAGSPVRNKTA